jgi:hypothetical protein
MTLNNSITEEQKEAINRFFSYAKEYLDLINQDQTHDLINRNVEHFLIFLTVAVENWMQVVEKNEGKIFRPSLKTLEEVEGLHSIVWTWEARKTVAHRFMKYSSGEANLTVNGKVLLVNGKKLKMIGLFLKSVKNSVGNLIDPPNKNSLLVFQEAYEFWFYVFNKWLTNEIQSYTYKDLWASFLNRTTKE